MITAFAIVWIASVWVLIVIALSAAATIPLMRRRTPDPPDEPARHGLPGERVRFPSRDGLLLSGWWIPAQGARGTVIVCSGQNGSLDADIPQTVPLHAAGFNVLLFDWRAHGRSEGELVTIGALEQADLFGALDHVQGRGIAQAGVLGFSMGAGVALMVAAQDPRIVALVVDGAYPTLGGILTGWLRQRGIPAWLGRGLVRLVLLAGSLRCGYWLSRANPADFAAQIRAPVLFIHGDRDPFVSPAEIEALRAAVRGPAVLWRVPEAGHREAVLRAPQTYPQRVVAWFAQHMALPDSDRA